jgi:hypothetical protein
MKQKLKLGKPLRMVITTVAIFVFTILAHHFSVELVSNNFIDAIGNFKLTQELPSVLAQTPQPTTTPTPQPITTSNSNSIFLLLNNTNILLWIALIGVFVVLFSLLSPITGSISTWWKGDTTNPTLKDKGDFLFLALPKISESITIILVIIVVTALTVSDKIQSEGAISLLSSIVGFVLGKKSAEDAKNNPLTPTQAPTSLSVIPTVADVKFDGELTISVVPAQDVDVDVPQNAGSILRKDKSTIVYKAPPQVSSSTTATITVRSKEPSLQPVTITINLIP